MSGRNACDAVYKTALEARMINAGLEAVGLDVAGGAAHQRIGMCAAGKSPVIKQITAKFDALNGEGIVVGNIEFCRKAKRNA